MAVESMTDPCVSVSWEVRACWTYPHSRGSTARVGAPDGRRLAPGRISAHTSPGRRGSNSPGSRRATRHPPRSAARPPSDRSWRKPWRRRWCWKHACLRLTIITAKKRTSLQIKVTLYINYIDHLIQCTNCTYIVLKKKKSACLWTNFCISIYIFYPISYLIKNMFL